MTKKIPILIIILALLLNNCKEVGNPYIKWRNFTSQNMINRYDAISEIRATKDSVLMRGISMAVVEANVTYRDTSVKFLHFGFCYSAFNKKPLLKSNYNPSDSLENFILITFPEIPENLYGIPNFSQNISKFKIDLTINPLKVDQEYYIRSFIIYQNRISNVIDTVYNSQVTTFRTRVPEDFWFHKPDFQGLARTEAVSFVIKNYAFVGCGYDGLNLLKDFWIYNPHGGTSGEGTWSQISSPSTDFKPRMSAVAIPLSNDTVLIGLGVENVSTLEPTSYFKKLAINFSTNPISYNWSTPIVDSFPSARYDAIGFSVLVRNNVTNKDELRAYIVGGRQGNSTLDDIFYYDPSTDSHNIDQGRPGWKSAGNYPAGKISQGVVALIGNIAIVGGGVDQSNIPRTQFYKFDVIQGQFGSWGPISNFTGTPRTNAVAFSLEYVKKGTTYRRFYYGTGKTQSGEYLNDWWMYDYTNDKWTQMSDIIDRRNIVSPDTCLGREGAIGFSIKKQHVAYGTLERGFIGLGNNASVKLADIWEYLP